MLAVIYLYTLGLGMIGVGSGAFIRAIVQNQPEGPTGDQWLTILVLVLGGLTVTSITRLLYVACFNSGTAANYGRIMTGRVRR